MDVMHLDGGINKFLEHNQLSSDSIDFRTQRTAMTSDHSHTNLQPQVLVK